MTISENLAENENNGDNTSMEQYQAQLLWITVILFTCMRLMVQDPLSTYFTKLKDLWAEYDSILPPPPSATEYIKQLEYQLLLQFLMGLNDSFEQARSQILLMPTLPSIDKAYAMVVQEESKKSITGGSYGHNDPTAMFIAHSTTR
ncbi:uncharacterized protein LOC142176651 [Nicotiana tabacum]|uniref:Uncharacterized protein LOC142176651 n=1 Tax=Nicotiana tabacum TaxID=4097 RepID=A0AC58TUF0_TOBAC